MDSVNPPPWEGFAQAMLGTVRDKESPCSLGEGLLVCLLGQNDSEKLLPEVRSDFLEEIQKYQSWCTLEWKPIHLGKSERRGWFHFCVLHRLGSHSY